MTTEKRPGPTKGRRLQITVPEDVAVRWESSAREAGVSLSSWVAMQVHAASGPLGKLQGFYKLATVEFNTLERRIEEIRQLITGESV